MTDAAPSLGYDVPSNQPIELFEVLIDKVGTEDWLRFRFLAPTIGKKADARSFAEVEGDFEHLCTAVAQPYIEAHGLTADIVAIAMLDRPVTFGQSDPEATQYVDVFRITSGACVWEGL